MIKSTKFRPFLILLYCWVAFSLSGCNTNSSQKGDFTEQLLAQPPKDWVRVYRLNNEGNRISEFVPANEDPYKWANKIVFESFQKLQSADPIELLLYEVEQYQQRCEFVQHYNLFSGLENGYPTSLRMIMCGKSKQLETGEVSMLKAIQGEESFYVVRISRWVPAFKPLQADVPKPTIATWSTYMKHISLCNPAKSDHLCPQPTAQEPATR